MTQGFFFFFSPCLEGFLLSNRPNRADEQHVIMLGDFRLIRSPVPFIGTANRKPPSDPSPVHSSSQASTNSTSSFTTSMKLLLDTSNLQPVCLYFQNLIIVIIYLFIYMHLYASDIPLTFSLLVPSVQQKLHLLISPSFSSV